LIPVRRADRGSPRFGLSGQLGLAPGRGFRLLQGGSGRECEPLDFGPMAFLDLLEPGFQPGIAFLLLVVFGSKLLDLFESLVALPLQSIDHRPE
jgi:hypothetical protein